MYQLIDRCLLKAAELKLSLLSAKEGRIALFTSELVESDLIMLQKNRAGHGQGQGYKF